MNVMIRSISHKVFVEETPQSVRKRDILAVVQTLKINQTYMEGT